MGTGSDDCIVIGEGTNGCSSSSTSISSSTTHHPSRLAEILAHKVKIKQEKIHSTSHAMMYMPPSAAAAAASLFHGTSTTSTHAMMNPHQLQQHQQAQHFLLQQQQHYQQGQFMQHVQNEQEADLVPKSNQDFQIVSQLRQMGFNNNDREIMVALRAIEKKRNMVSTSINVMDTNLINSFIDDIMLYIVVSSKVNSWLCNCWIIGWLGGGTKLFTFSNVIQLILKHRILFFIHVFLSQSIYTTRLNVKNKMKREKWTLQENNLRP